MKSASTPDTVLPPRVPNRFTLVLRSSCVGVATMVVTVYLCGFIALGFASRPLSEPHVSAAGGGIEVGWDLVTLVHNLPWHWLLLPGAAFAAGFALGFRYFSRARS